jgi:uncharacterized repeat protein (TIGR03803 family)
MNSQTKNSSKKKKKILYRFTGNPDGAGPAAGVIRNKHGDLYGTTVGGGFSGEGTIFRLAVPAESGGRWKETILHRFKGDAYQPMGSLAIDKTGNLYGTATGGGALGGGQIFRASQSGSSRIEILHDFAGNPDGAYPASRLVFGSNGNMFGTTQQGGVGQACGFGGCGTVFEVSP